MKHHSMTVAVLASCLAVSVTGTAFGQSDFSGSGWLSWPQNAKGAYVAGWLDGRQAGAWEAVGAIEPDLLEAWNDDPRIAALSLSTTASQIMDGIDAFYSDYRNRRIELRTAIGIVLDEASGRREWPEEDLRKLRQMFSEVRDQT